jgi:predicted RNase H-like nuclease
MRLMTETVFIGIDLAWSVKKQSGIAVVKGDRQGARLVDLALVPFAEPLAQIIGTMKGRTVVAIDAPLIIKNTVGQRPCETLVSKCYASRHAGCHTSNLSLHPDNPGVRLAAQLESLGFQHAPQFSAHTGDRIMLEVYPHPALIELFRLPRIIKYKKGRVSEKRRGQRTLQHLLRRLCSFSPPLNTDSRLSEFLAVDANSLKGASLKDNEDKLDAIVCAYIAYHYWYWGSDRNRLFGDVKDGYIIVPRDAA